jgi:pyruvate dehydrogenase E1 component alpha subunit
MVGSSDLTGAAAEELLAHLATIWRIRAFEERVRDLRREGDVVGSVHLCIGQEAIPVGACQALDLSRDTVFATYRGHGWALACGASLEAMFGELLGRATGTNGGRAGSAYLSDPDHGFYGENSIVGAGAPIACGAALAAKFDGSGRVALTDFGDGAMNQGAVHEALNFAAAFDLPVVFLVENNRYSELTPIADMVRNARLVDRAAAYGIPGERIDGNDPVAVADAVGRAAAAAREGSGPTLLEAMTERLVGHYIGDMELSRAPGELDAAMANEPVTKLRRRLGELGVSDSQLDDVEGRARQEVAAAAEAALAAPWPDPATVREHLYA